MVSLCHFFLLTLFLCSSIGFPQAADPDRKIYSTGPPQAAGNVCSAMELLLLPWCSHCCFPSPFVPHSCAHVPFSALSQMYVPRGATTLANGLSYALQCVQCGACWNQLCPARSSVSLPSQWRPGTCRTHAGDFVKMDLNA